MRPDELEALLNAMNDEQFAQFRRDFGGDEGSTRKWYVDNFATSREKWEPKLSRMFGIPTEQERNTRATVTAADAAVKSADAAVRSADAAVKSEQHASRANEIATDANIIAKHANWLSYGSMIVAGIALVVSIITALRR